MPEQERCTRRAAPGHRETRSPQPDRGQAPSLGRAPAEITSRRSGAERDADADLARALRHGLGQHAVEADASHSSSASDAERPDQAARRSAAAAATGWSARSSVSSARIGSAGSTARIASRTRRRQRTGAPRPLTCSLASELGVLQERQDTSSARGVSPTASSTSCWRPRRRRAAHGAASSPDADALRQRILRPASSACANASLTMITGSAPARSASVKSRPRGSRMPSVSK